MNTRAYADADAGAWDDFVQRHPQGSPFHLIAWKKSIEQTFGFRSFYLVAEDGAGTRGVLPLFLVSNRVIGEVLISSPFAVYGGVLADCAAAADALRDRLQSLASSLQVDHVELRNAYPEQCAGFTRDDRHVTFTQDLRGGADALLGAIPRKTRYTIRKALAQPFSTRRQETDFAAFENLYSENLQRLGTPSFPPRHFERLIANFGRGVDIREVLLDGDVVAAVMSFYFRDQVLPYYGAAVYRYRELAPTSYMYFDQMRWAAQNGYRTFDFGRSTEDSGSSNFKAHWGMKKRVLPYELLLVRGKELPLHNPDTFHFRTAKKLWRNLPLQVARALGPKVVRLVP